MVKFQTTAQISKYVYDVDRQWRDLQNEVKKANRNAALAQKEAERAAKRAAERANHRSILLMLNNGIDKALIMKVFSITDKNIAAIQKKYSDKDALDKLLNEPLLTQVQA